MKNVFLKTAIGACLLLLVLSCSDNDDKVTQFVLPAAVSNQTTVINTVSTGTWKITLFSEDDENHTANFAGYNFTFGSNNVLRASNGSNAINGVWSVTDGNSSDDSIDDLDFNLSFSAPDSFEDLSDDWEILERTDTKIRLREISGGNGGTELLTFEKN